jgi:signal transduction histidine kinase/CheY-like chemotaxis protein
MQSRPAPSPQRLFAAACVATFVIAALFALWLHADTSAWSTVLVSDVSFVVFPLAAAAGAYRAASRHGEERRAWLLLSAAFVAWALGSAAWGYDEFVLASATPYPSLADVGYLAYGLLAIAATLSFPTSRLRISRLRTLADSAATGAGMLFLAWAAVLGPVFRASGEMPTMVRVLCLVYPFMDAAVASLVLAGAACRTARNGLRRLLLGWGLVLFAGTTSAYHALAVRDAYKTGMLLDLGWALGFLLVLLASFAPGKSADEDTDGEGTRKVRVVHEAIPYAPLVLALAVLSLRPRVLDGDRILVFLGIVVVTVGFVRQVIIVAENIALSRQLRQRARLQEALAAVSQDAVTSDDLSALFSQAVNVVTMTLDVPVAVLMERSAGDTLEAIAASGPGARSLIGLPGSHPARVLANDADGVVVDYAVEGAPRAPCATGWCEDRTARSGAYVLVQGVNGPFAVLGMHPFEAGEFDAEEVAFLRAVASVLAGAIRRRDLEVGLSQAQKMEAVGRLAGGIAHDFNNLLTAILGYCELAMMRMHDERGRGELNHALREGQRAAGLVAQLLTFSRGRPADRTPVNLNDLVADMSVVLATMLGERVELVTDLADASPTVLAERHQLDQVLLNLALNARDAMPGGGRVVVSTALAPDDDGHDSVVLTVSDAGIGMDELTAARALEPFFTTKPVGQGMGLGLPTVFGIVRGSGGEVTIDTTPGSGTTVTVRLPAIASGHDAPGEECARSRLSPMPPRRILLVEDQATLRSLMCELLAAQGHELVEARNGLEAIDAVASSGPVDLIVTDVVMPQLDGPSLVRHLRASNAGLPVLFVSGFTTNADDVSPDSLTAFLQKPFGAAEFVETVGRLLQRAGAPGGNEQLHAAHASAALA